jgi:hypothetical protein
VLQTPCSLEATAIRSLKFLTVLTGCRIDWTCSLALVPYSPPGSTKYNCGQGEAELDRPV